MTGEAQSQMLFPPIWVNTDLLSPRYTPTNNHHAQEVKLHVNNEWMCLFWVCLCLCNMCCLCVLVLCWECCVCTVCVQTSEDFAPVISTHLSYDSFVPNLNVTPKTARTNIFLSWTPMISSKTIFRVTTNRSWNSTHCVVTSPTGASAYTQPPDGLTAALAAPHQQPGGESWCVEAICQSAFCMRLEMRRIMRLISRLVV